MKVAQIVSQLCTGNFICADGYEDPNAVLEELEAAKHKLDNVEALSRQYSSNQVCILNMCQFAPPDLHSVLH